MRERGRRRETENTDPGTETESSWEDGQMLTPGTEDSEEPKKDR